MPRVHEGQRIPDRLHGQRRFTADNDEHCQHEKTGLSYDICTSTVDSVQLRVHCRDSRRVPSVSSSTRRLRPAKPTRHGHKALVQHLDVLIDPFFTGCCLAVAVRRTKRADNAAGQTAENQGTPTDRSRQDRILRQDANFTELDVLSCLVPLLQGFYGFRGGWLTVELRPAPTVAVCFPLSSRIRVGRLTALVIILDIYLLDLASPKMYG